VPAGVPRAESAQPVILPGQWVLTSSIGVELLPVLVAVLSRTRDTARRWVALGFLVWFVQDCVVMWMAVRHLNNHLVVHLGNPVATAVFLLAYAAWMDEPVRRRALRIAAAAYFLVWAGLFLTIEDPNTFSQYTDPLQALVLILVCANALVRVTERRPAPVWRHDVFWISIGLLLDFGTGLLLAPVSGVLVGSDPSLVVSAYVGKAGVNIVAYLLVTLGMLCAPSHSSTGVFSLRQASPS